MNILTASFLPFTFLLGSVLMLISSRIDLLNSPSLRRHNVLTVSAGPGVCQDKSGNIPEPGNLRVFTTKEEQLAGRQMFYMWVNSHIDSLMLKRRAGLSELKSPADWKARQKQTRDQLPRFFGEFPEKTPLNARVTGTVDRDGYTIEKVIFESQPEYYVTANLYIPKGRKLPVPGVVFPCGHSDEGKARDFYHMTGLGLALKGYVVLIFDPVGQGERSEYHDTATGKPSVSLGVSQHHYTGKPALLADWSLAGLRTWDGIRAVDYLVSRPEVDKDKIAAAGCSGGGQMAMLITAVDERIKVCAASHPGGSMEQTYLLGQKLIDREIFSLIPPRPLRIIVGNESGEEPGHREKLEDMQLFYEGLRAGKQTCEIDIVPGVHSMSRSNRESAYEWLNKWLDREAEGKAEALLNPENIETLWCTESGNTIISLGGETGRSLNVKRADLIYNPEKDLTRLKERIAARTGFAVPNSIRAGEVRSIGSDAYEDIIIEKFSYVSEKGIKIPSLLIKPKNAESNGKVYIYSSDKGKPDRFDSSLLPFLLAKSGSVVLAIDVRGIGETSPTPPLELNRFTGYTPLLWQHDVLAVQSTGFGRTTLGMRAMDIIGGINVMDSLGYLKGKKLIVVGEGLGGLWALLAAGFDARIGGVAVLGTLPSYKMLIAAQYYNVWGYFFVPGALRDFDIPDLARLVSPKPQLWIDPVDALGEKLSFAIASATIGLHDKLSIITFDKKNPGNIVHQILEF
jgi:cephalosporin-C deacetylase-like acetyl esterase